MDTFGDETLTQGEALNIGSASKKRVKFSSMGVVGVTLVTDREFIVKTEGPSKGRSMQLVNIIISASEMDAMRAQLATKEEQELKFAVPGPGPNSITFYGQVSGAKNGPELLKGMFKGDKKAMRAHLMTIEPVVVTAGQPIFTCMCEGKATRDVIEGLESLFPPLRAYNLRGEMQYKKGPWKVGISIDCIDVDTRRLKVPLPHRMPWNPMQGTIGAGAVMSLNAIVKAAQRDKLERVPTVAFPICGWTSPTHCSTTMEKVFAKYFDPASLDYIVKTRINVMGPDSDTFTFQKQVKDKVPAEFKEAVKAVLKLLRMERARDLPPSEGVFDPNLSCSVTFGIQLEIFGKDCAGVGITNPKRYRDFCKVHSIPAVILAEIMPDSSVTLGSSSDVKDAAGPLTDAFLSNGRMPKNGFFHAKAVNVHWLLPYYLKDNAVPITKAYAMTLVPSRRLPADPEIPRPLSHANKLGVFSITECGDEDIYAAMNAGKDDVELPEWVPGQAFEDPIERVCYFVLVAQRKMDDEQEYYPVPWTKEQLQRFSELTPAQGDALFVPGTKGIIDLSSDSVLKHAYSVSTHQLATELTEEQREILGDRAYRPDTFKSPFLHTFDAESETDMAMAAFVESRYNAPTSPTGAGVDVLDGAAGGGGAAEGAHDDDDTLEGADDEGRVAAPTGKRRKPTTKKAASRKSPSKKKRADE